MAIRPRRRTISTSAHAAILGNANMDSGVGTVDHVESLPDDRCIVIVFAQEMNTGIGPTQSQSGSICGIQMLSGDDFNECASSFEWLSANALKVCWDFSLPGDTRIWIQNGSGLKTAVGGNVISGIHPIVP